ncbi:MAG: flagellar biosynthetic protein FliR [Candidatus Kapaibacteriales bacterium]
MGQGILEEYVSRLILTFIIFFRITGLFLIAPIFKMQVVRPIVKVFLGIALAFLMSTIINQPNIELNLAQIPFILLIELMVGFTIGYAVNLVFWGARFAGGIIDFELGFMAASLLSFTESTPSIFGEVMEFFLLMLFLSLNGHYFMFEALVVSYQKFPIGSILFTSINIPEISKFLITSTIIALKLSAPIFVATFLINISLAMLARMAPQTNIFVVSFQIKIASALIIFFTAIPLIGFALKYFLQTLESFSLNLLMSIS